jgi:hypothetical protein
MALSDVTEMLIVQVNVYRESTVDTLHQVLHHDVAIKVARLLFIRKFGLSVHELSLTRANGLWYIALLVPCASMMLQ